MALEETFWPASIPSTSLSKPFETLMLVRLDRFSSDVGVTLHHNHICFKSESEFITDDWMDPQYYF